MNAQQQRRRLFAELQTERDKMAAQWDQQRREMEEQQADSQVGWGSYSLPNYTVEPLAKIVDPLNVETPKREGQITTEGTVNQ